MDQSRLWTRMTQWIRRGSAGMVMRDLPRVGRDGLLEGVHDDVPALPGGPADEPARRLSKQELREHALARLENGHEKLVLLTESIRQHLDAQDRQSRAMVQSLVEIGGHLSKFSESVVKQTETLGAMSAQIQAAGDRAQRIEAALADWPAVAESQRNTLRLVAEQVSAERQAVDRIGESVQTYGGALASLDRSSAGAAESLRNLQVSSVRTEQALTGLGRRQSKWLVLVFSATVAIVALAAALVVIALVR